MELSHLGDHIPEFMQAIFDDAGSNSTLSSLQNRIYRDTDSGVAVSFELDDGTRIYPGDGKAANPFLISRVKAIGLSAIVEGSDSEVPLRWVNLLDEDLKSAEMAVSEFNRLVDFTDEDACSLCFQGR